MKITLDKLLELHSSAIAQEFGSWEKGRVERKKSLFKAAKKRFEGEYIGLNKPYFNIMIKKAGL